MVIRVSPDYLDDPGIRHSAGLAHPKTGAFKPNPCFEISKSVSKKHPALKSRFRPNGQPPAAINNN
jgi:hypothetical protein